MTSTWFHRWLQRHDLYESTTNTAKGRGQKAVSMKPEEMILPSRTKKATYWAWPYPTASDPGSSKTQKYRLHHRSLLTLQI